MPDERQTSYREWLNDTDSIFIWFTTERGVVRYDTAHGFAHRDILDPDGQTVRWEPMREVDYARH
jgi:hypothetical protein